MLSHKHDTRYRVLVIFVLLFYPALVWSQPPCYQYPDPIDNTRVLFGTFSLRDSILDVRADIRSDYRIIGYVKPDSCSKRQVLFSVFTRDVAENPYKCDFGAYYSTAGLPENVMIKYRGKTKGFVLADILVSGIRKTTVYFERRWVRFTKE